MGQIMLILLFTAILSLILGMGLPTTANYIVVSSLLAPVIVALGQQNGLIVPLIAVHLFVFYFGIMADVTPPVGLASFAAAAVSGGDPIRTGFVAFFYSLRTALLPFLFIFNTDILLIDVTPLQGAFVFVVATAAMLVFTAGVAGLLHRQVAYLGIHRPDPDCVHAVPTGFLDGYGVATLSGSRSVTLVEAMGEASPGSELRAIVEGLDEIGDPITLTMIIKVGDEATGQERLEAYGLEILEQDGKVIVDNATFDSPAQAAGFDFDQTISILLVPVDQPAKEWFYIPALALLGLIYLLQRRRRVPVEATSKPAAEGV